MARVTLNYWAGARSAAGMRSEQIEAADLDEALARARARRARGTAPENAAENAADNARENAGEGAAGRFADVLAMSSLMVDGRVLRPEERSRPLSADVVVEVLPPFAGGSHWARQASRM